MGASVAAERSPGPSRHLGWTLDVPASPLAEDTGDSDYIPIPPSRTTNLSLVQLPASSPHPLPACPLPTLPATSTPINLKVQLLNQTPHVLQDQLPKLLQSCNIGPAGGHSTPLTGVSVGSVGKVRSAHCPNFPEVLTTSLWLTFHREPLPVCSGNSSVLRFDEQPL